MSAREVLHAAICGALAEALDGVPVFDAPPVRAPLLHIVVEEPVLADWSAKAVIGREGRLAIRLHDSVERPLRLRALTGLAEDAIEMMDPELGEGWRAVTLALVRSRIVRGADTRWTAMSEFRVRMLRTH